MNTRKSKFDVIDPNFSKINHQQQIIENNTNTLPFTPETIPVGIMATMVRQQLISVK